MTISQTTTTVSASRTLRFFGTLFLVFMRETPTFFSSTGTGFRDTALIEMFAAIWAMLRGLLFVSQCLGLVKASTSLGSRFFHDFDDRDAPKSSVVEGFLAP